MTEDAAPPRGPSPPGRAAAAALLLALGAAAAAAASLEGPSLRVVEGGLGWAGSAAESAALELNAQAADPAHASGASASLDARGGLMDSFVLPAPVTDLAAVSVSSFSISYSWTAPAADVHHGTGTAIRYVSRVSPAPIATEADFAAAADHHPGLSALAPGSAESAVLAGLSANTTYTLAVEAVNGLFVRAALSNVLEAATLARAPAAAAFLAVWESSVTVGWAALPAAPQASSSEGYVLEASSTGFGGSGVLHSSATPSVALSTLTAGNLLPNTTYTFRVGSLNHAGQRSYAVLGTTPTAPAAPVSAVFTGVWQSSLTLSWAAGGNPPGSRFRVELSSDGFASVTAASETANLSIPFAGLFPNTDYDLRLRALGWAGRLSAAAVVSTRTAAQAPAAAADLAGTGLVESAALSWTAPGEDGDAGNLPSGSELRVQYSLDSAASWSTSAAQVIRSTAMAQGNAQGLTLTGLAGATTYYFRLWHRNAGPNGWSPPSNVASAFSDSADLTVAAPVPAQATGRGGARRLARASTGRLYLAYLAASGQPAVSFSDDGGAAWTPLAGVPAEDAGDGRQPALALDGSDRVHSVWVSSASGRPRGSRFNGSWSAPVDIDAGAGSRAPASAVDSWGALHVLWRSGADAVRYSSSTDGGLSWSPAQTAAAAGGDPSLAVDRLSVPHALWTASGVVYHSSRTAAGWSPAQAVAAPLSAGLQREVSAGVDPGGVLHAVFTEQDGAAYQLRHASWTPGGGWSASGLLSSGGTSGASEPGLAFDAAGRPRVLFSFDGLGGSDAEVATIRKGTGAWTAPAAQTANGADDLYAAARWSLFWNNGGPLEWAWTQGGAAKFGRDLGVALGTGAASLIGPSAVTDLAALQDPAAGTLQLGWSAPAKDDMGVLAVSGLYRVLSTTQTALAAVTAFWDPDDAALARLDRSTSAAPFAGAQGLAVGSLSGGASHYLRLFTRDLDGNWSALSNGATAVALPYPPLAAAFSGATSGQFTLAWSSSSANDPGVESYQAEVSTSADFAPALASLWGGALSASFGGLIPNTTYYARARARNAALGAESVFASAVSGLTLPEPPGPGAPPFSAVFNSSLTAHWLAGANPAGTEYRAEASTVGFGAAAFADSGWTTAQSFTFTGLAPRTTAYVRVKARGWTGAESAYGNQGSTVTADQIAPAAITDLAASTSTSPGTLWLSWTAPGSDGGSFDNAPGARYVVRYATVGVSAGAAAWWDAAKTFAQDWPVGPAGSRESRPMLGLLQGVTYYLAVKTQDASGNVSYIDANAASPAAQARGLTAASTGTITLFLTDSALPAGFPSSGEQAILSAPASAPSTATDAASPNPNIELGLGAVPACLLFKPALTGDASANSSPVDCAVSGMQPGWVAVQDIAGRTISSGTWIARANILSNNDGTMDFALRARFSKVVASGSQWTRIGLIADWSESSVFVDKTSALVAVSTVVAAPAAFDLGEYLLVELMLKITDAGTSAVDARDAFFMVNSSTPSTIVPGDQLDLVAPAPVADLAALPGPAGGRVRLVWTAPGDDGTSGNNKAGAAYSVRYSTFPAASRAVWWTGGEGDAAEVPQAWTVAAAGAAEDQVVQLAPNARYYFGLRTTDAADNESGQDTGAVQASTWSAANAPAPALAPLAEVSSAALTAAWLVNGNPAGTRFVCELSSAPDFAALTASSVTRSAAALFAGLAPNTAYHLRVRSLNEAGAPTLELALGSTVTLPAAPAALGLSADVSSVSFSWTSGGNPAGTDFEAQLSSASDFSALSGSSVTRNASAPFAGLASNATFYARVRAVGFAGALSAFAPAVSTITLPAVPAAAGFGVGASSLSFSWTAGGNAAGTEFEAQLSSAPDFSALSASSVTRNASAPFPGLAPDTTYYARVRAAGFAGALSAYGAPAATATLAASPAALPASDVTQTQLRLNWGAGGNPAGTRYEAELSTSPDFSPLAVSSATTDVSAPFAGLAPEATYYARVRAVNRNGVPTPDTVLPATVTTAFIAPAAVTDLGAAAGAAPGTLTLSWTAPGRDGTVGALAAGSSFAVQYSSFAAAWSTAAAQLVLATGSVAPGELQGTSLAGLLGGTTYFLRLWTLDEAGTVSAPSNEAAAQTRAFAPVPATLSEVATGSLRLDWGGAGNGPAVQYRAEVSTSPDGSPPWAQGPWASTLSQTLGGLAGNTSYYARGKARTTGGLETAFTVLGATTTLAEPPGPAAPPFGLVAPSSFTFLWLGGGNAADTLFEAQISSDAFSTVAASSVTAALSAAFAPSLDANTTYFARARALGRDGTPSPFSATVSTVTLAQAPGAPAVTAVHSASVTVSWTPAAAAGYRLEASTDAFAGGGAVLSSSSAGGAASLTVEGLAPETTYTLRVAALNWAGAVNYAAAGSTRTPVGPPLAPGGLAFLGAAASGLTLSWSPSANSSVYRVEAATVPDFSATAATAAVGAPPAGLGGLAANTTYYLHVRGENASGVSAYSAAAATSTLADPPASAALAGVFTTSVTANWLAGSAAGYRIEASSTGFAGGAVQAASAPAGATALTVAGLTINTTYTLRLAAFNWNGVPAFANLGAVTTLGGVMAPVVSAVRPDPRARSIRIDLAPGNPPGTRFLALRRAGAAPSGAPADGASYAVGTTLGDALVVADSSAASVVDSGLALNAAYYYAVYARSDDGFYTAPGSTGTVLDLKPADPAGLARETAPDGLTVTVRWDAVRSNEDGSAFADPAAPAAHELAGYEVWRATSGSTPGTLRASLGAGATAYSDAALGAPFYYYVVALDSWGLRSGTSTRVDSGAGAMVVSAPGERVSLEIDETLLAYLQDPANPAGEPVRIAAEVHPAEVAGNVLASVEFYAQTSSGARRLERFAFPTDGLKVAFRYEEAGGKLVFTPLAAPAAVFGPTDLGVYWNDGRKWVKLYGDVDAQARTVSVRTANTGKFQVRALVRGGDFSFDASDLSSKFLTPNGDKRNDRIVWRFQNPRDSAVSGKIYTLRGLKTANMQPGPDPDTLMWDGRSEGQVVPGGIYIYALEAEGKTVTGTILVIR